MTATPPQPNSPSVPPVMRRHRPVRRVRPALDHVVLAVALPVVAVLALPAAFAGGGTRRWFGGRAENQRAEAQAAKDAAAAAFY
ncbi:hypothetical protein ACWDRX_03205, partial [Streptomyces nigra]